jgi:HlyD family secretion protein
MAERLRKFITIIKKRRTPIGIVLLVVVVGGVAAFIWGGKANASDYITAKVDRGTVEVTVSATGTVQAVVTVQVGSQVSGTVSWLGADFNSQVKKGQIVARLDPAIFQAQVDNARANVGNADAAVQAALTEINNQKANEQAAKANQEVTKVQRDDALALVKRYEALKDVLSGRDLEAAKAQASAAAARYEQAVAQVGQSQAASASAKAKLDQAKASVAQAKAMLQQAQVNLDHSIIPSPIDGVVVSRAVDVGQTVAASLSAPTLFTIANDLTKMQVLASIDEADVGQVRPGIKANFSVDAYPGETFSGDISQLRLNAQTLQNVVTYSAVIDVTNTDLKLRPGMTANITVPVARRDNVMTVPNAALRFKPANITDEEIRQKLDQRRQQRDAERQGQGGQEGQPGAGAQSNANANAQGQEQQPAAQGQGNENRQGGGGGQRQRGDGGQGGQGGQGAAGGQGAGAGGGQRRQSQTVWVLTATKTIEPRFVRTGLTNGRITEIMGDIHEGDTVVIGQNDSSGASRQQPAATPFGQQPRPGGGGGRPPGR